MHPNKSYNSLNAFKSVHRDIIVGACQVVYQNQPLQVQGVQSRELEIIINYAYTKRCNLPSSSSQVLQLLKASVNLDVIDLIKLCSNYLIKNLDEETVIELLYSEQRNSNLAEVLKVAKQYALRNFVSSDILTINSEISALETLLRDDHLNCSCEEDLVIACLRWVYHDLKERSVHFPRLLRGLRLCFLSPDTLEKLEQLPLVSNNATCRGFIENTKVSLSSYVHINTTSPSGLTLPVSLKPRLPHMVPLLIGGWIENFKATSYCLAYDHHAGKWIGVPWMENKDRRMYHGLETVNDSLYIIGGMDCTSATYLNTCLRMKLNSDSLYLCWEKMPGMMYNRCFVTTAVLNGNIYAIGGRDKAIRHVMSEYYDTTAENWILLPTFRKSISDTAVTYLDDKLYVAGGFGDNREHGETYTFNPMINSWLIMTPLKKPRSALQLVGLQDCLYAIGGFDGRRRTRVVERYNPYVSTEWEEVAPMITGRSNFAAVVMHQHIYVFGGYTNAGPTNLCEMYSPIEDKWYPVTPLPTPRSGMACCVVDNLPFSQLILSNKSFTSMNPWHQGTGKHSASNQAKLAAVISQAIGLHTEQHTRDQ